MAQTYNIDRKTASRLLDVSLRTVDRYLSAGKISSVKNNGRVWLSQSDVLRIAREHQENDHDNLADIVRLHRQVDNFNDNHADDVYETRERMYEEPKQEQNTYKNLYEEAKQQLVEKQQRLDQATYRVGQLEAQVQSMVPLVDFQKQQKLLSETTEKYSEALKEEETKRIELAENLMSKIKVHEDNLRVKEDELETERFNKAIFAVILFIILSLQPILWLILR